ncbi:Gmad2 immunoglobulin-like domain-containing protein [Nocardioides marmorisolisilvae]|uniref:GerMN domain-containing protein n=1 Tax=Nocardioides marmorisolisilvae TaxID=1542737 RepID=A0A3N0DTP6_9ACTN|nr:Gmad2 immunoglobulin-like domain-containing protein [Nocardioides marmorisolisilvae]RNL78876.1 hypothetical protein EFL95_07380 [Nocardioides marmorisolisilvae]
MTERDQHDDLRQLFQDATSDVRPQGSLDDILDRSKKVDPMTRRWFLPVVAAAAVIGFVIGGAVWIAHDSNTPKNGQGPSGPPTSGTDAGTVYAHLPIYYLGDTAHGTKLFREVQRIQVCDKLPECGVEAAAREAVAGTPQDPDYRNPWPADTTVMSATYDGNVLTLNLHTPWPEATGNGPRPTADEKLAVQQLIYTAQDALGRGRPPVQLIIDDHKVPMILGVSTEAPLQPEDPDTILAPVQIESPAQRDTVPAGDLKVTGVASTFEANVQWELLVGGDAVVQQGHTTATECCTLSPFEFTIKNLEPGTYTLVVHDEDMSGDGRAVNQDTKEIVVE